MRSTGPHSQNHHFNGHVAFICKETGNDFDTVKTYLKNEAVSAGYPFDSFRGEVVPRSEAKATVEQCCILIEAAHRLAAELGIRLEE
jgi:hypothetical protein